MTKQTPEEAALKWHLTLDEANKVENSAVAISNPQTVPELKSKLEVTSIRTGMNREISRLGKVILKLYDLEDGVVSRKPVKLDLNLNLYQMEKI